MPAPGFPVSVVVPTYQRRESVSALRALAAQDLQRIHSKSSSRSTAPTTGREQAIDALSTPDRMRSVGGPKRGRATALNDAIRLA